MTCDLHTPVTEVAALLLYVSSPLPVTGNAIAMLRASKFCRPDLSLKTQMHRTNCLLAPLHMDIGEVSQAQYVQRLAPDFLSPHQFSFQLHPSQ